ncbi:MAG: type II secretion system secretin GspD [Pseudomonadales bacterium]
MKLNTSMRAVLLLSLALCLPKAFAEKTKMAMELRNVDIREFIELVGNATDRSFIIDPRVKGVVDIRSKRKLDDKELYAVFLSQLRVNGFAVVPLENGVYKIIPEQLAKQEALPVQSGSDKNFADQMVTRVLQVEHVEVDQLVPILRPLVDAQAGVVAPYAPSNVIMITDRAANIQRIVDVVARIDKAGSGEMDIIKLRNAKASEIVKVLSLLIKQGQASGQGKLKSAQVVSDERSNAVLVKGPESSRRFLREMIYDLDGEREDEGGSKVFYLKYAKATELVELTQKLIEGYVRRVTGNPDAVGEVVIQAHEGTNSILASGSADVLRELERILSQVDIRRAQVMVEAIIVDITDSKARDLGVQWLVYDGSGNAPVGGTNFKRNALPGQSHTTPGIFDLAAAAATGDNAALGSTLTNSSGLVGGIGTIKTGGLSFAAMINALESNSDANVLSTPSLLTLDNEEASILVGQEIPVVTGSQLREGSTNPFQTIERKEVGIKLKVTPQVNEGNSIKLAISQEVSGLSTRGGTADVVTDTRNIDSTVMIEDGDTIVLGGLISDELVESFAKVPLLGDIPFLGELFRSRSSSTQKRNLMVFIRPTIVRDSDTLLGVSHRKYSYIRAQQKLHNDNPDSLFDDEEGPLLPEWNNLNFRTDNASRTLDRFQQELR